MTTLADDAANRSVDAADLTSPGAAVAAPGVPSRADGVRLLGEQPGSGYRVPPALVQRRDGQVLQLTPLLYAVLSAVDGARSEDGIAAAVSSAISRDVRGERSEEHTSELQSHVNLVCRLLLEKKKI